MPYTIVLTPPEGQIPKYEEVSQTLYSHYEPRYLLSAEGKSFPHITVVQFDCDSDELAYRVWIEMCDKMEEKEFQPFVPPFTGVSFVDGVGPYNGTTWVELSVARGNETSPIMKVHHAALEVLKSFQLQPLNASGNNYRPHLTLARIVMPKQMEVWAKTLFENTGHFGLEFGVSDEKWQFARSMGTYPVEK